MGLIGAVLVSVLGPAFTYNLLFVASFVLSGIGTYALAKFLTQNKFASFFSGTVYAFSPFRTAHGLGHLVILQTQWFPFFVLFLIRTVREPSRRNPLIAAAFLALTLFASSYYYVAYEAIISGLFVAFALQKRKHFRALLSNLALFGVISIVLLSPWTYFVWSRTAGDPALSPPLWEVNLYSADILTFVIPSFMNPLWKSLVSSTYSRFTANPIEQTQFLGYTVMVLAIYAILSERKNESVRQFTVLAILSGLLALGTTLHILGNWRFTELEFSIPLPYLFLYSSFSPARFMRVPSRFGIVVMLAVAILAAFALRKILGSKWLTVRRPSLKKALAALLLAVVFVEFLAVPYPSLKLNVPIFYSDLAQYQGDFAILEVPMSTPEEVQLYLWYQTIHQKRIVGGAIARVPPEYVAHFIRETPVVSDLLSPRVYNVGGDLGNRKDILVQDNAVIAPSIFDYYNIEYVIIHKDFLSKEDLRAKLQIVQYWLRGVKIFEDQSLTAYRIRVEEKEYPFLIMGGNWYPPELWSDGTLNRWMENNGTLRLVNPSKSEIQLRLNFMAASLGMQRTLYVEEDGSLLATFQVTNLRRKYSTPLVTLDPESEVSIRFFTPDPPVTPLSLGMNGDVRPLTLAFQNVSLTHFP